MYATRTTTRLLTFYDKIICKTYFLSIKSGVDFKKYILYFCKMFK